MRLNKFFSEYGICSRRKADKWIEEGRITINDQKAVLGDQVEEGDVVKLDGEVVGQEKEKELLVAYHKPVGVESTMDERDPKSLPHNVDLGTYFFMMGRLDQNSEGLMLLTNQGDWVNLLLRSKYGHEKEYQVRLDKPISEKHLEHWRRGVDIGDEKRGLTLSCTVERMEGNWIRVILKEGRHRQIRKVADALGYYVRRLRRVRVANIEMGELSKGKWREVSPEELKKFKSLIEPEETSHSSF
jgi:23S rRNA pseudouridine2604 synthase